MKTTPRLLTPKQLKESFNALKDIGAWGCEKDLGGHIAALQAELDLAREALEKIEKLYHARVVVSGEVFEAHLIANNTLAALRNRVVANSATTEDPGGAD